MENRYFMLNINFGTPIVMNRPGFKKPADIPNEMFVQYEHEHFKEKLNINQAGRPIIPMQAIQRTLRNAVRFCTLKPPKGFRTWTALAKDCLLVLDDAVIECGDKQIVPWHAFVNQQGRMGKTVMVETVRPMILLPASAGAKVLVFDDRMNVEFLEDLVDIAGRIVGFMSARTLGNGRATIGLQQISKEAL